MSISSEILFILLMISINYVMTHCFHSFGRKTVGRGLKSTSMSFASAIGDTNDLASATTFHKVMGREVKEVFVNVAENKSVLVLEAAPETQVSFVNLALQQDARGVMEDPYGIVMWPSSVALANLLLSKDLSNHTVVELGSGIGLLSLALAMHGNQKRVIATDYNNFALKAMSRAWNLQKENRPTDKLLVQHFDLNSNDPVPPGTMYVLADVLYNPPLGRIAAHRIAEIVKSGASVILGDSPGRTGREYMLKELKENYSHLSYSTYEVTAMINQDYRHDLISSHSNMHKKVQVTVFEFNMNHQI
jgi:predicted nicotinamide N-methyase